MRDRPVIYCGLALFLGLATFPAWRNLSTGANARGPNPVLPASQKQCVAPVAYMKASHGSLLIEWRDIVVRQNTRDFTAFDGKHYNMSLTATCLKQCHGGKADFCDRCHTYAAVSLTCWSCHQDSRPAALLVGQAVSPARLKESSR
jgi:hypothetical protein